MRKSTEKREQHTALSVRKRHFKKKMYNYLYLLIFIKNDIEEINPKTMTLTCGVGGKRVVYGQERHLSELTTSLRGYGFRAVYVFYLIQRKK